MALRDMAEEQPELARALRREATKLFSSMESGSSQAVEIDDEVRSQLQALGYVP